MATLPKIGIFSPSYPVSIHELEAGMKILSKNGFTPKVHPQTKKKGGFYAGSDEERAAALFELAKDPTVEIIWAGRGGYGAIRLLHLLEDLTALHGAPPPGKLYVGFSDSTPLLEYVRSHWSWSTLHASMPAHRGFLALKKKESKALFSLLKKDGSLFPPQPLTWLGKEGSALSIQGELVGGNFACLLPLIGTPYCPSFKGKILFLEDVSETWVRMDRMVEHLILSEALSGLKAIVLGNFSECSDSPPLGLSNSNPKSKLKPIRKPLSLKASLLETFGRISTRLGIPVAYGLPSGHGPDKFPLPLGATYRLKPISPGRTSLELQEWGWLGK